MWLLQLLVNIVVKIIRPKSFSMKQHRVNGKLGKHLKQVIRPGFPSKTTEVGQSKSVQQDKPKPLFSEELTPPPKDEELVIDGIQNILTEPATQLVEADKLLASDENETLESQTDPTNLYSTKDAFGSSGNVPDQLSVGSSSGKLDFFSEAELDQPDKVSLDGEQKGPDLDLLATAEETVETELKPETLLDPLAPQVFQDVCGENKLEFVEEVEDIINDDFNVEDSNEAYVYQIEGALETTVDSFPPDVAPSDDVFFIEITLERKTRTSYYQKYIDQRTLMPGLSEQEIDAFLRDLETNQLDVLLEWPLHTLENYLFHAMQRFELVGQLPISNEAFFQLVGYLRRNARNNGKTDQKRIPPVLFVVSMVFCARYSDTDVRDFWEPYACLVWGLENSSPSFQQRCRNHFINCREDLQNSLDLIFNFHTEGDVVRPVYQHAIIPNYLQGYFAEWLVNNFDSLLHYSVDQLPIILENEKSLDYVPPRLREFIRSKDTKDSAAQLITQMLQATRLFYQTEQVDAVESVLDSSIERSLWQVIYRRLIEQKQLSKLRKISPHLEWCWDCETEELFLYLSHVRSIRNEKPDSVFWVEKDTEDLKENDVHLKIYPWAMESGDWEVDPIRIPADGPLNGSILVLSEEFDLEKNKQEQVDYINFEREVPQLQKPLMFFCVNTRKRIAVHKDKIDSEGEWIIATSQPLKIIENNGNEIKARESSLPSVLLKAGFIQVISCYIQLPIAMKYGEDIIKFEQTEISHDFDPILEGSYKVKNLSLDVPPIFKSPNINFMFSVNLNIFPLRRIWLSINRGSEFIQSVLLADLLNQGKLKVEEGRCVVNLEPCLGQSGSYTVNLLYHLNSLLAEPVSFAWLPDYVEISEPDLDICYSPLNPLQISVSNVTEKQIITYHDEKSKITTDDNCVKVEWKILKDSQCRFAINWEGSLIHFSWNIDRVSAWIEGGDKNQLLEGKEKDALLQVRGKREEEFVWIIANTGKQRKSQLNAKGEFQRKLLETELRDMLLEVNQARSQVMVSIRGFTWKLFEYYKIPQIDVLTVNYQKPELEILIKHSRKIRGNYTLQLRCISNQSQPYILAAVDELDSQYKYQINLSPGTYRVEILLDEALIKSSLDFLIEEELELHKDILGVDTIDEFGSTEHLFRVLTASKQDLLSRSYDGLPITPAVEQLQIIHSPEEWLTDEPLEDCFKRLLPSWAVLMYPLRFTTKEHRKILHVFPEQVAFGGKVGKGYVELKLEAERVKVAAYWRPGKDPEYAKLWMRISQNPNITKFCELDPDNLWPAYQCVDCGMIVASRIGSYLKLAPSLIQNHRHAKFRNLSDQFIDTVYKEHVEVNIAQYKGSVLIQAYKGEVVAFKGLLQALIDKKISPVYRDLEQPINLYSNHDYLLAVSNILEHLQHPAIKEFIDHSMNLNRIMNYMSDKKSHFPAFSAVSRLAPYIIETHSPFSIPGNILFLCMALRLKPHNLRAYNQLLSDMGISDEELMKLAECVVLGCPKMLEWAITWAELFYVHAVS